MKRVSILGTGWLGLPLALSLRNEFEVKVSIRTNEKKKQLINKGLSPYLLNEKDTKDLDKLLDTDYLFINFPPSKFDDYLKFLGKIYAHEKISKIEKIIFISSTSIYPDEDGIFNENIKFNNPKSKIVFDIEEFIKDKTDVIFRCAGLMGENRISGRYFAGKLLDSGDVKVNYVHQEDVIEATKFAIKNTLKGVYNLCSSKHPTREEIYLNNAEKYGFEKPVFKDKKEYANRIIDGSKIEKEGFSYKYPNPLDY